MRTGCVHMALGKSIAAQQEDVSLNPSTHTDCQVWLHAPVTPVYRSRDNTTPEACWLPAQLQSKTLFQGNEVERDRGLQAFRLAVCVHKQQPLPLSRHTPPIPALRSLRQES